MALEVRSAGIFEERYRAGAVLLNFSGAKLRVRFNYPKASSAQQTHRHKVADLTMKLSTFCRSMTCAWLTARPRKQLFLAENRPTNVSVCRRAANSPIVLVKRSVGECFVQNNKLDGK